MEKPTEEEVLIHRLTSKAWESLKNKILFYAIPILGSLAFIGYNSVDKMQEKLVQTVHDDGKKEMKKKMDNFDKESKLSLLKQNNEFDKESASNLIESGNMFNENLLSFIQKVNSISGKKVSENEIVAMVKNSTKTITSSGYAYYGIFSGGDWTESNFRNISNPEKYPVAGDVCIANLPINTRSGVIEFIRGSWQNKPISGILKAGNQVKVIGVEQVFGAPSYVWIKFESVKS